MVGSTNLRRVSAAPVACALLALAVLSAGVHAQQVTFTPSRAAWTAAASNTALVATFSESLWPVNALLSGSWTLNGVSYSGHAGTPGPNIYVINPSPLSGNALTANGDEDIDLVLSPLRTAIAFDIAVNPFGPVSLRVFDATGVLIGETTVPANTIGFIGCLSRVPIGRVNFRSVLGAQVNSLMDNVQLGDAPCSADFNLDGAIDFFDYLDFVDAFSALAPESDFNHDGSIDFFDYLDFVDAFSAGC